MVKKIITGFALFLSLLIGVQLQASEGVNGKVKEKEKDLILNLTSSNYDKETARGLVFVDFWAAWCGPCRRMAPILQEVAEAREGKVIIAKLNVDDYKDLAKQKNIDSLPTIVVYKDGKELTRVSGLVSKQKLIEVVDYLDALQE